MRRLGPAVLMVAGAALMGIGRAEVMMPLLLVGQVLMLIGVRRSPAALVAAVGAPALMLSASLVFLGSAEVLFGGVGRYLAVVGVGTLLFLGSWLVDRWAGPRLPRWAAALVFPAIRVPIEVAGALGGPTGVWGSMAAPAAGLWPLSGIVAIGGFSLLSFMLLWLASSSAYFWEDLFERGRAQAWKTLAPCVLALVALNAALSVAPPHATSVRVGSVAAPQTSETYLPDWLSAYGADRLASAQIERLRPQLTESVTQTLRLVELAAGQGARIVYTAEGDAKMFDSDRPRMEAMAGRVARAHGIWLGLGVHEYRRQARPLANMILLFAPDGTLVSSYEKTHPIGNEVAFMIVGRSPPVAVHTPYGEIAGVICYDTEFLAFTRQVARTGADILFAPSSDWPAIAKLRGEMTRFRTLETGMALVRPTHAGVSEIIAPNGRVLARAPYDPRKGVVLVANVPTPGRTTLYARVGDWPAAASLVILLLLCGWAFTRARAHPATGF